MESMGQRFKAAREKKRVSLSQAALKTHIKIQHLEAMERDDFSRMPAPIYARGFIKSYCDFLGLDPAAFIREYNEQHGGAKRPAIPVDAKIIARAPGEQPLPTAKSPEEVEAVLAGEATAPASGGAQRENGINLRMLAIAGAAAGALLLVIAAIKFWPGQSKQYRSFGDTHVVEVDRPAGRSALAIMREPPEPFVEINNGGARTP